jgi:hypothetical protein
MNIRVRDLRLPLLAAAAFGAAYCFHTTLAGASTPAGAMPSAASGDFDWCVAPGQTLVLDTSFAVLNGGPHCASTTTQSVVGGVVDVRHMWIQEGALVRVVGPNPLKITASGAVRIDGTFDLSGVSNPGVTTLNTTNIQEQGSPGSAGGGRGGTGNPLTTSSSPKGDSGFGAFNAPGMGGGGGETGWNNVAASQLHGRRGAGGGGGAFGHNQAQSFGTIAAFGDWDQSFIGLDVESGFSNMATNSLQSHNGALTGPSGPHGGRAGTTPFFDGNPDNDFYGQALELSSGALIVGELSGPWAGAGGGGGGNASFVGINGTFPQVPFNPAGDEKGAGGAGGGGSLQILAQDDIVFGARGLILCRGGSGGGGENTSLTNRIGGGSGGGSGGHVILQTKGRIDFRASLGQGGKVGALVGGILATGGQGGAGRDDQGGAVLGAQGKTETLPHLDACPPSLSGSAYPTAGPNGCKGHVDGAGGDGGPGVVQLHTRTGLDPAQPNILLPLGMQLGDLVKPTPVCSSFDCNLIPTLP